MNTASGVNHRSWQLAFLALSSAVFLAASASSAAEPAALTNAAQLRQLTRAEAQDGQPVRLRGTVTYSDPRREILVVQDDTDAAFVRLPTSELPLARGQQVSVEGISTAGDFSPGVGRAAVKVLGHGEPPPAKRVTLQELDSGRIDGHRVEVRGIVGEIEDDDGRALLHLHIGRDSLNIVLRDTSTRDERLSQWIDAEVIVRGIARITMRANGRDHRLRILTPGLDEVTIERPASSPSYSLAPMSIREIRASNAPHRVKVIGRVVSTVTNRSLVVRDDTVEIEIRTRQSIITQPGDRVEALGFPTRDDGVMILDHGVARVVGSAYAPKSAAAAKLGDGPPASLPVLQTIGEVNRLPVEEAARGYPVRLRGVVTYCDDTWSMLFIRDATNGIFAWPRRPNLGLRPGQIVEVTGFSSPGDFVPVVVKAEVVVKAQGELPPPIEVSYETLLAGREDSQWVAIDGIVRSIKLDDPHIELDVAAGGGRFIAYVNGYTNQALLLAATNLIDAEVRVLGVCSVLPNPRRQAIGFRLFTPSPAGILLKQPAPAEPFALSRSAVESLFGFGAAGKPGHRVRVGGVVTQARGSNSFFLHDGTGGLHVEGHGMAPVRAGDRVEVVGFPVIVERAPHLENAVVRGLGFGPAPLPHPARLGDAIIGRFDGELITLDARLVDVWESAEQASLILHAGDTVFEAALPDAASLGELKRLPRGGLLRVKGIGSTQPDEIGQTRSFRLLMHAPTGVEVLQRPPWWDLRHALRLGGVLSLIVLGSLAWVWLLRKRVREQTSVIRQRLETESRLESRYRELFDNATDIVYTTDLEGRITSFNKAAEALTGYSRVEAVGRNLAELVAPNQAHLLRPFASGNGDDSAKSVRKLEFVTKDGARLPVEVDTQPLIENGRTVGAQGIARDITDRRRAERVIHELNASLEKRVTERTAELQAANKELEAFSYSVSHDLRAPLRAINGFAEILLKDHSAHLEGKARRYLQNVAFSGRKMGQLVDDLLAFSRLNRHAVASAPLDLSDVASEVLADLRRQEPARNVAFTVDPLPATRGDRALLRQVLYNLLSNAWKFTANKPAPSVRLGFEDNGHGPVYFVRDNGAGFDMNYADKLFGVFQRLHRDDEFPGTGVGLAIVQRIIHRHGGRIWAEAGVDEGATFYFTLPGDPARNGSTTPAAAVAIPAA